MKRYSYLIVLGFLIGLFACNTTSEKQNTSDIADTLAPNAALYSLNQKIEADKNNDAAFIECAEYYLLANNVDSALRDILIAIDIDKNNSRHYVALSDAYLAMGNPDKCHEALEKAVQIDPENKDAILKQARLYLIMRDYERCYKRLDDLIAIDRINPRAYYVGSIALLEEADTAGAIKNLRIAIDQDPEFFDAQFQLGVLLSAQKDPLAINYLQNALTINPQAIQAYYQLGLFFQENNRLKSAVQTYQSILDIEPAYYPALYNLGYINLVYQKDFAAAADYFTQVINLVPDFAEAWYNRAYSYELMGKINLARKDYQQTLVVKNNYPKAIEALNRLDGRQ